MCYHVSFEVKLESVLDFFPDLIIDQQPHMEFTPKGHIDGFNHQPHYTMVRSIKDNKLHLPLMVWGMVPSYIKNMEEAKRYWNGYTDESGKFHTGYTTLNAMGEELFDKLLYKESALKRRCIIMIDGFYESYHYYPIGKKGLKLKTKVPYPHHINLKENKYPFIMVAGIWNVWRHTEVDPNTSEIINFTTPCFSLVTTAANELMAKIHNSKKRMPTILTHELAQEWMAPALLNQKRITEIATYQYPAQLMNAYSIPRDYYKLDNPKTAQTHPELEAEFCL